MSLALQQTAALAHPELPNDTHLSENGCVGHRQVVVVMAGGGARAKQGVRAQEGGRVGFTGNVLYV